MNFKQIEAFRSVILSGSMTAAATELHTSQPNVSRLISQLERSTGFKLFKRVGGRLQATPEARLFYQDVERSFIGLSSLERSAASISQLGVGRLRIGAVPSMALTLVPKAIRHFSERFPDVHVSLYISDSITVAQWAASHYCDVGIASYVSDTPGVDALLMNEEDGVCILPRGHPLARLNRPLTPADMEGERFFSLSPGDRRVIDATFDRRVIDATYSAHGHDNRVHAYECPYSVVVCKMVALGMGISIINPIVAHDMAEEGVEIRPFQPRVPFSTYRLTPLQYPSGHLTDYFIETLSQQLAVNTRDMKAQARAQARLRPSPPDA